MASLGPKIYAGGTSDGLRATEAGARTALLKSSAVLMAVMVMVYQSEEEG
jgi:hypothetical protein